MGWGGIPEFEQGGCDTQSVTQTYISKAYALCFTMSSQGVAENQHYMPKFLKKGWMGVMRGKIIVRHRASDERPLSRGLVAGGTMFAVMQDAIDQHPDNVYVKMVKASGIPNCIDLVENCPDEVAEWAKREANNYHQGGHFSHVEVLDLIPVSEAEWHTHKNDRQIKVETCPSKHRCCTHAVFSVVKHFNF